MSDSQEPVTIQNPNLLAAILEQMNSDRTFTTNSLLDGYRTDAIRRQAELDAIRWKMDRLFEGDYMPTPAAVQRALWPSDEVIEMFTRTEEPS